MKKILLFIFFIATCNQVFAYSFMYKVPSGQNLRFTVLSENDKTCAVSSRQPQCNGTVSIPSKVICKNNSYEVIEIEEEAFSGMKNIDSIYLPASIKKIGYRAFFGCSGIEILEVPSGVKTIELNAFYNVPYVHYEGKASGAPWGAKELDGNYTIPSSSENSNVAWRLVKKTKTLKTHDEAWYRNYFKDNIKTLDPIEGVYSVSLSRYTDYHGNTSNTQSSHSFECFIVKHEKGFLLMNQSEEDLNIYNATIIRIGESNFYDVKLEYTSGIRTDDSRKIASTRIELLSLFRFIIKTNMNYYFPSWTYYDELDFIKEYPTPSMYEETITQIEEETQPKAWSGTGYAIGNGYIATNHHVIDGAKNINIKGIKGDMNNGYSAEVVATDKVNDMAVLRITDSRFNGFGIIPYSVTTRMADVGEDVFVLGYPLTQVLGNEIKLTNGIINSRTGYQGDVATYQMSAPVQPGNSGGPMFDSKGNIIGIVVAGVPGAENVGYAIKTSYLKILIESAGLNITFPTNNTISTLSLAEKVKRVKNYVFYIECSK